MGNVQSKSPVDDGVDEIVPVAPVSSSLEGVSFVSETASGSSELEGPDEVVGLLEVRSAAVNFVDQIFNAVDVELSKAGLDGLVARERDSLSVDFGKSSFVDELFDGFSGGISKVKKWRTRR